ncbi:MAG TPA: S-adenosyl-l-methionine hydroxide adenosyltransferase family protein [Puia sp.]|nr:S-adenosyl-l-methionine hydroxide adenosyltransferase family protein [Puia sp.]
MVLRSFLIAPCFLFVLCASAQNKIVVYQSDFGLKDGAVSEMKGVAIGVSPDLKLFDLTHEIPAYDIWEAAYRLQQTVPYWPAGTVFVSVVDPGVGTARKSVVLKTKTGQFIVTPDNGTLTLVAESLGIAEIREIDESVNRRVDSKKSYTFHGRDVYSFTAARLAAGVIRYEQVGPLLARQEVVSIPYQKAVLVEGVIKGSIPVLDVQYGNIWTNIPADLFQQWRPAFGDLLVVTILHNKEVVYQGEMPYCATFGSVPVGRPLAYLNSLLQLSFALNQGSFAQVNKVSSGNEWSVEVRKK